MMLQRLSSVYSQMTASKDRKAYYKAAGTQLKLLNLEIYKAAADGNCLFSAYGLCKQGRGYDGNHCDIRKGIYDYMEAHRVDFEYFVDNNDFDHYISVQRQDGQWAGEPELVQPMNQ